MRFEIQGNNVSFQNAPKKDWLPVDIVFVNGIKTFWVERSDKLERIRIILDNDDQWLK